MSENTTNSASLKSAHTPGPWRADIRPESERIFPSVKIGPTRMYEGRDATASITINEGPSPEAVEKFKKTGYTSHLIGTTHETAAANARLIAAAPELLDALRTINDRLTKGPRHTTNKALDLIAAVASAAISKAEGSK